MLEPVCDGEFGKLKDRFQIAVGNDADSDRHGIVTPSLGLMNPNHYLAVAIHYLLSHRPQWSKNAAVGKTLVSSCLIDRVVGRLGRKLFEVPVGFKWFSQGLFEGSICFGGEESAGASFLCRDGTVWTTDKDGIILALLAAEIIATTGREPGAWYEELTESSAVRIMRAWICRRRRRKKGSEVASAGSPRDEGACRRTDSGQLPTRRETAPISAA